MRGHDLIIRNRMAGIRPVVVFMNDWPCLPLAFEDGNTVSTDGEPVDLMDLRFVVGLVVSISSESETRAKQLFEACKAAGATMVAACHQHSGLPVEQKGWAEVWKKPEVSHG